MNRKTWAILSTAAVALLSVILVRPTLEPQPAERRHSAAQISVTPSTSEPSIVRAGDPEAPSQFEASTSAARPPIGDVPAAVLLPKQDPPHHPGELVDEATILKLHGERPLTADHPHVAAAIEIQERNNRWLMAHPAVAGTAIGLNDQGAVALIIYTKVDAPELPKEIEKLPVAVFRSGEFTARLTAQEVEATQGTVSRGKPAAADPQAYFARPVPIGVSTGHPDITAGTIGCSVLKGGVTYALSNNHVYADSNEAEIGDNALQPGPYDGGGTVGGRDDVLGTLAEVQLLDFNGNSNAIDAAIVKVKTFANGSAYLGKSTPSGGYGTPKSTPLAPAIRMKVQKYGRTTGQTSASIGSLNGSANVNYGPAVANGPNRIALFTGQIFISGGSFSLGGDSGSLIVSSVKGGDNKRPVGLLFAGGSGLTIANPIGAVLSRFGVTINGD